MRSCLFQSSERDRLHEFLHGAAADADRARMLQQAAAPELALEAAQSLEWDRCSSRKCGIEQKEKYKCPGDAWGMIKEANIEHAWACSVSPQ